jgi:hypothetical protein
LRAELVVLEPGTYDGDGAAALAEELAGAEKACAAARARLAVRAVECGAHRGRGHADPQDWMATVAGSSVREARSELDAVREVEACPDTQAALVGGEVSLAQAAEIARAEAEVAGVEGELLEVARGGSLGAVRTRARKRRLEAIDREELQRRQVAARELRHWVDELGMVCGSFRLPPVSGQAFVTRLAREAKCLGRADRRAGGHERFEALAADALVAMTTPVAEPVTGTKGRRTACADVVIVQSAEVARRGHVHDGELCHVVGGGPVAPSEVEELLAAGAFVKAVLHDGEQVTYVAHYGRHLSAAMRTARGIGVPPEFDGRRCVEPGCERRLGLETDHRVPVAAGGPTSGENLDDRCMPHHWEKTQRDRRAGLLERGPP